MTESSAGSMTGSSAESMRIQRDADQQGRWPLPARGARVMRLKVRSIQHSMQHSVLCLSQVGLTVLGRPWVVLRQ